MTISRKVNARLLEGLIEFVNIARDLFNSVHIPKIPLNPRSCGGKLREVSILDVASKFRGEAFDPSPEDDWYY
jgi:hypothetical protein